MRLGHEEKVAADPVELFFDLVFVFAVAQLVGFVHGHLDGETIGRALLLLGMLWWAWSQFTWAASAIGNDSRPVRLAFLAAMVVTIPLAASVTQAFGDAGEVFGLGYAGIRILGLVVFLLGSAQDEARASVVKFASMALAAPAIAAVGGFFDPGMRTILWVVALIVEVGAALSVGDQEFRLVPSHFAERHGLFIIIALGETVVAVGLAVSDKITEPATLGALAVGGLLSGVLWWSYFDWISPRLEQALADRSGAERGRLARDAYTLGHFPVVAGIVLFAVTLEEVAAHADEAVDLSARSVLAVSLVLVFGGLGLVLSRGVGRMQPGRLLLGLVAAATPLPLGGIDGTYMLLAVAVVLVGGLLVEQRNLHANLNSATAPPSG